MVIKGQCVGEAKISLSLDELKVYQLAMNLGEEIWKLVGGWNYHAKDTIGKQLIRAADSVAANLGEGFGRFFYKENRQFCYCSRGSLFETRTWLTKARNRSLVTKEQFDSMVRALDIIAVKLNNYINSIGVRKESINTPIPK